MTIVRRLRPEDDFDDLVGLSRDFFDDYVAHHEFFRLDQLRDEDIRDFFSRSLSSEEGATIIAELEGRIVAYITVFVRPQADFWQVKEYGAVSGLMVHRDHRGKGLAGRMLAEAIEFFRQKGIRYYTAYTAVTNHPGIAFYEGSGMLPLTVTLLGETEGPHE